MLVLADVLSLFSEQFLVNAAAGWRLLIWNTMETLSQYRVIVSTTNLLLSPISTNNLLTYSQTRPYTPHYHLIGWWKQRVRHGKNVSLRQVMQLPRLKHRQYITHGWQLQKSSQPVFSIVQLFSILAENRLPSALFGLKNIMYFCFFFFLSIYDSFCRCY